MGRNGKEPRSNKNRPRESRQELISETGDDSMNDAALLLEPLSGLLGTFVQKVVEDAVQRLVPPPPPPEPVDRVYSVAQAAPLMVLSEYTVREMCRRSREIKGGEPFGCKLGSNRWCIRQSEVDRWWQGQILVHGRKRP